MAEVLAYRSLRAGVQKEAQSRLWPDCYRHSQGTTIYAGISEIHRSLIAERARSATHPRLTSRRNGPIPVAPFDDTTERHYTLPWSGSSGMRRNDARTFASEEDRFVTFGLLREHIVAVAHTEDEQTIKFISARKATKREEEQYFKAITDSVVPPEEDEG